jgi:peptide/nickel transport system substrate-binding protein
VDFNIRKGITFGSGKTLDADDVIYSINLHRGETKSPAKGLLAAVKDITKTSPNQIQITMRPATPTCRSSCPTTT